jgi:hypothetical protein
MKIPKMVRYGKFVLRKIMEVDEKIESAEGEIIL